LEAESSDAQFDYDLPDDAIQILKYDKEIQMTLSMGLVWRNASSCKAKAFSKFRNRILRKNLIDQVCCGVQVKDQAV
jgi:hypothetical protein